jgi:hypothetical protein
MVRLWIVKGLRFNKLTAEEEITPEKKFSIPLAFFINSKKPNYVSARNGKLSFGWSDMDIPFYYSRHSHRRFWKIPSGVKVVRFPDFRKSLGVIIYVYQLFS